MNETIAWTKNSSQSVRWSSTADVRVNMSVPPERSWSAAVVGGPTAVVKDYGWAAVKATRSGTTRAAGTS